MTRKEMLRELDRLRAEIEKPEPDLRDVMAKLEAIEARLGDLERKHPVVIQPQPVPVIQPMPYRPYRPYSPWDHQIWCLSGSASASGDTSNTFCINATN